jgi:intracellular multiplication protein IcmP
MPHYPNPRASWPSNDDTAGFNLIVIIVGICAGAYLLWTNYHAEISAAVMMIMHREIVFIDYFTDRYTLADRQMVASNPRGVTLSDLYGILHAVGMFFRVPATALIALLAIVCAVRAAPSRYRRAFDLEGLIREQARSFPVMAAFVGRDLGLVPAPPGRPRPADYALTPREWAACFARGRDGRFDPTTAEAALVAQLGPRWIGFAAAPPVARLLFVAFGLHLRARREETLQLLALAGGSLPRPERDEPAGPEHSLAIAPAVIAQADALFADRALFADATAVASKHAYTTTALMGLLNGARLRGGVLAPAQFAWLRLVDRPLWYALHSLGYASEDFGRYLHPNPRAEAAGARDHWAAERAAGGALVRPNVGRALQALSRAASST